MRLDNRIAPRCRALESRGTWGRLLEKERKIRTWRVWSYHRRPHFHYSLPRACGGDSDVHFTAISGKPPTVPLPTLAVARSVAGTSGAVSPQPHRRPAPAFFIPGGGRIAREPYCRLVSSHVTPKLPRLSGRFRRIVPRLDTMRVVMHGYARKRHAKSQLGGINGGIRSSWHRLAQPCIAVHFSLPQGVTFRENRDPSETAESSRFGRRPTSRMTCRVTSG